MRTARQSPLGLVVAAVLLFLYAPIVVLVIFAFNESALAYRWVGFTLKWFEELASDRILLGWRNTILVSVGVVAAATIIGTMAAYALVRYSFRGGLLVIVLLLVPIIIPRSILGIALLVSLHYLGVPRSLLTVALGQVFYVLPFVIIAVLSVIIVFDKRLEEAAIDLGATPWVTFRQVTLPLILNGTRYGCRRRLHPVLQRVYALLLPRWGAPDPADLHILRVQVPDHAENQRTIHGDHRHRDHHDAARPLHSAARRAPKGALARLVKQGHGEGKGEDHGAHRRTPGPARRARGARPRQPASGLCARGPRRAHNRRRRPDLHYLTSGIGVNNLGHAHPAILDAVRRQSDAFLHCCFQVAMYEAYVELAARLHELTPGTFPKKTFFTTSGAEAVEGAVKFARAYTGRDAIVTLQLAFHGRTFYALQLTGRAKPYRQGFGPLAAPIHRIPFPYPYRFPGEDSEACLRASLEALDTLFRVELPPEAFAAVVLEPIQGEAGIIVPPEGFLRELSDLCRSHDILLIADDVQTGVWRTGQFCASAAFGIEPDLVAFAKSLGFGLPIGAVTGRAEVIDSLAPGGLGGTMGGNPLACAAALAGLQALEEHEQSGMVALLARRVFERLDALRQACPLVGEVRGRGLMIGLELVKDRRTKEPATEALREVVAFCREHGVLVLYGGAYQNTIRLLPPLTIAEEELDASLSVLERAVQKAAHRS